MLIESGDVGALLVTSSVAATGPTDDGVKQIVSMTDPLGGMLKLPGLAVMLPTVLLMLVILSVSVPVFRMVNVVSLHVPSSTRPTSTFEVLSVSPYVRPKPEILIVSG